MKKHTLAILLVLLSSFQRISCAHEEHHHEHGVKYTCIVGDYMTSSVAKAMKAIWQDYPFLKDRVTFEIINKTDLESGFNPNEMLDSNLILFDVHGIRISTPTQSGFDFEILKEVSMWMMMQHPTPQDWVLATGITMSVEQFATYVFKELGYEITWQGEGVNRTASNALLGRVIECRERCYRPAEVNLLRGDASKAYNLLGWEPYFDVHQLIHEMLNAKDL